MTAHRDDCDADLYDEGICMCPDIGGDDDYDQGDTLLTSRWSDDGLGSLTDPYSEDYAGAADNW